MDPTGEHSSSSPPHTADDSKASQVLTHTTTADRPWTNESTRQIVDLDHAPPTTANGTDNHDGDAAQPIQYRVYKRRFLGIANLACLNLIISWDWLTFAASSTTVAQFFNTSQANVNWLSTVVLFAFVVMSPLVTYVLNKGGPKPAMMIASALILVGNWIRYGGTRVGEHGSFGLVMFGQILIGFAQPFVLCAPTRYSDLWFTDKGRVTATAFTSLANPLGGALGQLINPNWATEPSQVPQMVLYVAIISTVTTQFSYFLTARPPVPPCASAAEKKTPFLEGFAPLARNVSFWLIFVPFGVFVAFFNATSSLINQIFEPYGFSETNAGIAGGILIIVGLITSAIVSPIIDRTKWYLGAVKVLVPITTACYIILIWMPQTRTLPGPFIVCAILGASSFSLLPIALEYITEITYPVSPETASTVCWAGSQFLGGVFIIIMTAMEGIRSDEAPGSLIPGLIFQAAICAAVTPLPLLLGTKFVKSQAAGRLQVDRA